MSTAKQTPSSYSPLSGWHGTGQYTEIGPAGEIGGVCPRCGSHTFTNYEANITGSKADIPRECRTCGLYWHDIYVIDEVLDEYECPDCGSDDIEEEYYEIQDEEIPFLICTCNECEASFDLECGCYASKATVNMAENKG